MKRSSAESKRVKKRRRGCGKNKNKKRVCDDERRTSAGDKRKKLVDKARSPLILQCSILTQSSGCRKTPAKRTSVPLMKLPS